MNTYNKLLFLIVGTVFISFNKTLYKTVHNISIISTGVATSVDAPVLAITTSSILDARRNESSTSTRTTTSISDNEKQQQVEDPLVPPVVTTSFSSSRRENNHTDVQSLTSSNVTDQLLDEDFQNRKNFTSEHSNEWQSEDNNSKKQDEEKYITYKLIQGGADYNFTFDPNKNRCRGNPKRGHLPVLHEKGVTDFRTVIETNLNIAYIGDSVGLQFSQSFQDAAGASYAQVIRYAWGWHALSHIAKVRGGGTVAGMRLTGPFLEERKNHPERAAPIGGGGWMEYDLREMKHLLHRWRNVTSLSNAYEKPNTKIGKQCNGEIDVNSTTVMEECKEEDFDVLVYQLPAGWMHTPNQLLNESMSVDIINRTVFDALKYFAPKTIILQTIPIINNVLSVEEYIAVNRNILKVVHEFRKQQSEGVTMLVMDVRALSTSLLMHNAMHIHALTNGTVPDATTADNDTFVEASSRALHDIDYSLLNNENYFNSSLVNAMRSLLKQRLRKRIHKQHWSSIISHTCGQFIQPNTAARCHKGNEYSWDGQHWCMDTMSGRIDGVVACLLECSVTMTKKRFLMHENDAMERFLDECEHKCNSQFMSLSPIPSE